MANLDIETSIFDMKIVIANLQQELNYLKECGIYKIESTLTAKLSNLEESQLTLNKKIDDLTVRIARLEGDM